MSHAVITFSLLHDDVLYVSTIFHVVSNYMPHIKLYAIIRCSYVNYPIALKVLHITTSNDGTLNTIYLWRTIPVIPVLIKKSPENASSVELVIEDTHGFIEFRSNHIYVWSCWKKWAHPYTNYKS